MHRNPWGIKPTLTPIGALAHAEEAARTYDDLVAVEGGRMQTAFVDLDADYSVFKRVAILKPVVAFRSNWQRDQNRSRTRNINTRDMDRIKGSDFWISTISRQAGIAG